MFDALLTTLQNTPSLYAAVLFVFGLLVGSFLNVVILRFPKRLFWQWAQDAKEHLTTMGCQVHCPDELHSPPAGLVLTRSHCPKCGHQLAWWENIPLVSWAMLKARCRQCHSAIGLRYPLVELITGLIFLSVALHYPPSMQSLCLLFFSAMLIALSGIDIDHQILPDPMVYILLWFGIFASYWGWLDLSLQDSVLGALIGYLSLWSFYWLFKIVTGKEGMGYGDFKLFAALGAWIGPTLLIPTIILAALLGTVIGVTGMLLFKKQNRIPFGPFLAAGGWVSLLYGHTLIHAYLRWAGLGF